jgi:hypothetical protein
MRPFKDYDKTQTFKEYEALPKGGYVLSVLGVSINKWQSGDEYLQISCDISEGEYAGFYAKRYKEDTREDKKWSCNYNLTIPKDDGSERDGWAKRRFKTVMNAFEDSNPGFRWEWNEAALKGKKIGGLFNIRQWEKNDGSVGEATNLAALIDVNKIASGDYKLPKDKLIEPKQESMSDLIANNPFVDDALPFS